MTIDFTDDELLGEQLRAEVPAPGASYWAEINDMLGVPGSDKPGQRIDVEESELEDSDVVVSFRSRLRAQFGGIAAIGIAAALLVLVGMLVGTRIDWNRQQVNADLDADVSNALNDPAALDALPGPRQNLDHWNAVYGVWDCTVNEGQGGWLPKFDSWEDDVGIHSHDDGLISIHPFFEQSAGHNATFSHFADAMNFELTDSAIVLPDGRTLLEGTLCGGQPAVVHLRRWQSDVTARTELTSSHRTILENVGAERFYNDREVWVLALAPLDAAIPVPPPDRFTALDATSPAIEYQPGPISASLAPALDADLVLQLELPVYPSQGGPEQIFEQLIRDPRPPWTDTIDDGTFRPIATANHAGTPTVVLATYRIEIEAGSSRACWAAINIQTQQIHQSSYCHPGSSTPPSSLLIESNDDHLFVRNVPADASYITIDSEDGTRILTNPCRAPHVRRL